MGSPVFALALDSVPPLLLESWLEQGAMPRLAALRAQSLYGPLGKSCEHPHEASWSALLQGCAPLTSGEWGQQYYHADRYQVESRAVYNLERQPPFYGLTDDLPSVIFDIPHAPTMNGLRGTQVFGWGLEANLFKCNSRPPGLLAEILRRHGAHPFFGSGAVRVVAEEGDGTVGSCRLPSVYDPGALRLLEAQITAAIGQRAAIIADLLTREPWRLVLASTSELHLAMHMLWHEPARLAAIASAFDASLETIMREVPDDSVRLLFSLSGMAENYTDLATALFLPEFLYRLQFGEAALAAGTADGPVPAPATHYRQHWKDEIWALRTARGERDLESPVEQEQRHDPFDWSPLNWYRPLWPQMRAFVLPSFSHGMVRINLRGRDPHGMVEPADYARCCDELTAALWTLKNARSGRAVVESVKRTRAAAAENDEHLPPADLIVTWNPAEPTDVVESSLAGRIGPVPWLRTGGHAPDGFCMINGPGISAGRLREGAQITDLTATLIQMLGITPPPYVDGHSLI